MKKTTMEDLSKRALTAISNNEGFVQDVADNLGQILDNVGNSEWFQVQVMFWLMNDYKKYSHLRNELEQNWQQMF